MSNLYDYLSTWREYLNMSCNQFIYLSKYYIYKFKQSFIYQKILSNYYGLSIAEKKHQTLKIRYIYEGNEYIVYVPFERKYIHKMLNQSVVLHYETYNKKLIQQPGVPYVITPKHLNAKSATIHTMTGDHVVKDNELISE